MIRATLESISEVGITDTTVSRIIEKAGLSRGMVHLHFGGKTQLLAAAAQAFSDEYYFGIDRHVQKVGHAPERIIMAVVTADLSEELLNERATRILHAFRGAASTHTGIAEVSGTRDDRLRDMIRAAFSKIAADYPDEDPDVLARDATFGLLALLEGMWSDYLLNPNAFSREVAKSIVCRFIGGLFPDHF
ncbi:TetR family transcriptional regulator C-terminal domain-containing protein [Aliiroseovarius subalbicans]|uniref:TetR family transcriptional regulator C-terminal domain-containing protein n=1 Tax=Aliiroseovarius subalbicans TaxID=2925840 RepID=UPI001F585DA5|nr:TetR family transcriptional regulator C-terminal domain-containing protein [Aliiroseovarius subalbicans]MCI2399642.1 TetR family transcriptional regulator [Aliiroseovarius subalbicans]